MGANRLANYMKEATYWQKMELIGSMISFLTIMLTILSCYCLKCSPVHHEWR